MEKTVVFMCGGGIIQEEECVFHVCDPDVRERREE